MSSFKPRVMCWIRGTKGFASPNNGRVVELQRLWPHPFVGPILLRPGPFWECVSASPLRVTAPIQKILAPGRVILLHQSLLVPINDPDLDVEEVKNDSIPAPIYANIKAHT